MEWRRYGSFFAKCRTVPHKERPQVQREVHEEWLLILAPPLITTEFLWASASSCPTLQQIDKLINSFYSGRGP